MAVVVMVMVVLDDLHLFVVVVLDHDDVLVVVVRDHDHLVARVRDRGRGQDDDGEEDQRSGGMASHVDVVSGPPARGLLRANFAAQP
jgi:hypothetical protein